MPLSVIYVLFFGRTLAGMPYAIVLTAIAGYVIADRVLGFRRQRSTIVAAIGIGILSAPWGVLLTAIPR